VKIIRERMKVVVIFLGTSLNLGRNLLKIRMLRRLRKRRRRLLEKIVIKGKKQNDVIFKNEGA